mmetsp:Transcript_18124/g.46362  ORF Transcript_18124/g.46362 Transcript_18124/m.46362 type:complete len:384 (-) Transcript_18124:202-1353(-)
MLPAHTPACPLLASAKATTPRCTPRARPPACVAAVWRPSAHTPSQPGLGLTPLPATLSMPPAPFGLPPLGGGPTPLAARRRAVDGVASHMSAAAAEQLRSWGGGSGAVKLPSCTQLSLVPFVNIGMFDVSLGVGVPLLGEVRRRDDGGDPPLEHQLRDVAIGRAINRKVGEQLLGSGGPNDVRRRLPEILGLAQLQHGRALYRNLARIAPLHDLASDVQHHRRVLDVPDLLGCRDETVAHLREVDARTLPEDGVVLEDEHGLGRVIAPQALLPQSHVRSRAAALPLGHVVQGGQRLFVVEAVELAVPLPCHEVVGDVVSRLGGKAAELEALSAHLALNELLAVDTLVQVDVHAVEALLGAKVEHVLYARGRAAASLLLLGDAR